MNHSTPEQAVLRLTAVRSFLTVLHAIKPLGTRQLICSLELTQDGLRIKWDDDSKSLQSSMFVGQQVFAEFSCPWPRKQLGLPFNVLLDTLLVFNSSLSTSDLVLRYPGLNEELVCEMTEESGEDRSTVCTYAKIETREHSPMQDMTDFWEEPTSFFIIAGSLLKEIVEDMEWAAGNGSVRLSLTREPQGVSLSASSTGGELEIQVPAEHLQGFQCYQPSIRHPYKYKSLRTTVANLPQARDASAQTSTKVTIDANGLIKVTHMMHLQGDGQGYGGAFGSPAGVAASQWGQGGNRGIVQFVSQAEEFFGET